MVSGVTVKHFHAVLPRRRNHFSLWAVSLVFIHGFHERERLRGGRVLYRCTNGGLLLWCFCCTLGNKLA